MRNIPIARRSAVLMCTLLAVTAAAAAPRTFVASYGNNANPCSLGLPCRGFAQALTQTDPGGEIIVLDSAGYGPLTIDRSLTIAAPSGIYAGVTVPSGTGIAINAPGITVTLRGLTINGQGGSSGIYVAQAAQVHIDGCLVSGLTTGILTLAGATTVVDTTVRDNSQRGISVGNGAASTQLDRVRVQHNQWQGIEVNVSTIGSTRVSVRDSVITDNGQEGIAVHVTAGGLAAVDVEASQISSNGWHAPSSAVLIYASAVNSIAEVSVARSLIARQSSGGGIDVASASGGLPRLAVTGSTIIGNYGDGIVSSGTVLASGNTLTFNRNYAFHNAGGSFASAGDNHAILNFDGPTLGAISTVGGI